MSVSGRSTEALLLALVLLAGLLGFTLLEVGLQVQQGGKLLAELPQALLPPAFVWLSLFGVHRLMQKRKMAGEQMLLPIVGLLLTIGLLLIWRLQGAGGVWQQLLRGYLPGILIVAAFILKPAWVERLRRWALPLCLVGLLLPVATAFFGVVDETGTRLALKLGPLPSVQPSEIIKVALLVFLAWYIERQGQEVEGRARPVLGWLRLPSLGYFLPGVLYVSLTTLALVQMSDYGAVLILTCLFAGMLFAGFQTRVFLTVGAIGLGLAVLVGLVLAFTWRVPTVVRYRFEAYKDPWSTQMLSLDGQPTGVTISEGPGYQIQQSLYSVIAGGLTGTGLGFGSPQYVPLAHSDFIFAAIVEELGAVTGMAVLILFAILILRIARVALLLPPGQAFERLLLIGVCIHFFVQVFIMVGGTLNLLPLTGVTIPFLSLGGMALMVNLFEVGLALALAERLEASSA